MAQKRAQVIAWIAGLALLALHLDFWRAPSNALYFGWLPEELGYRILWMGLAWIYLLCFCGWVWDAELDE